MRTSYTIEASGGTQNTLELDGFIDLSEAVKAFESVELRDLRAEGYTRIKLIEYREQLDPDEGYYSDDYEVLREKEVTKRGKWVEVD